jgi:ribosomal protein L11 methylase PrmA
VWDLGANQGLFSRIASDKGIRTISFDVDPACVEINYLEARKKGETNILPLLLDTTNPSPDLGWNNQERMSLVSRGPCDALMALALVHHLAISNNVPLPKIASHFEKICKSLIIEWVPKEDSQVQRLLATREDIFDSYTVEKFEAAFGRFFEVLESQKIKESCRILYLMRKKSHSE